MTDVLIVVDSLHSKATTQMVSAFKYAILSEQESANQAIPVEVIAAAELTENHGIVGDRLLCPFTLDLPETLPFAAQAFYATCRHPEVLRQQVERWHYVTGAGAFWLPIVLTAKGSLYAEVIGVKANAVSTTHAPERCYEQPIHLSDVQRQPLYALAQRLLRSLNAPPAVYLMQFGWQNEVPCFDRLLPFPAVPAIASLNVQTPDLFTCHWRCLTGKPMMDLAISSLTV